MRLQPLRVHVEKGHAVEKGYRPVSPNPMIFDSNIEHAVLHDNTNNTTIGNNDKDHNNKIKGAALEVSTDSVEKYSMRTSVIDLSSSIHLDDNKGIDRRGFRGNAFSVTRQTNDPPIRMDLSQESTSTLNTNPMFQDSSAIIDNQSLNGSVNDTNSNAESMRSDKDRVSLTTAESGIQRLTLHSRTLSQYTKSLDASLIENILPPYIVADGGPPPENWHEGSQSAKYIVQNRLVGWKLTQRPRRRDIINLFEMVEGVDHGTYAGTAQLAKLRKVTKNTLKAKYATSNTGSDFPPSLEDFINSTESESTETMSLKRREADAWRSTVTRLIRARDSTPAGIAARQKHEKEEKEKNKKKNKDNDDDDRQSTVKLLCSSDRLSILESARKQELMSREKTREREAMMTRERSTTPSLLRDKLLTPSNIRGTNSLEGVEGDDDGIEVYIRDLYSRGASRGQSRGASRGASRGQVLYEEESFF